MAQHPIPMSPPKEDKRGLSQAIFIAVGIAIILGGLWFLYQSTAPYHPDTSGAEGEIFLATDS